MTSLALIATACVSLAFGLTALRVGRRTSPGLVLLATLLSVWMGGLLGRREREVRAPALPNLALGEHGMRRSTASLTLTGA